MTYDHKADQIRLHIENTREGQALQVDAYRRAVRNTKQWGAEMRSMAPRTSAEFPSADRMTRTRRIQIGHWISEAYSEWFDVVSEIIETPLALETAGLDSETAALVLSVGAPDGVDWDQVGTLLDYDTDE